MTRREVAREADVAPALRGGPRTATNRVTAFDMSTFSAEGRSSEPRNAATIIKRALEDQSGRIDNLRGRVDEALEEMNNGGIGDRDDYLAAVSKAWRSRGRTKTLTLSSSLFGFVLQKRACAVFQFFILIDPSVHRSMLPYLLGVGFGLGYGTGFYDGGFYEGFGGFGVLSAQGTVFPDPCCLSGMATTSIYCDVWNGGGFNLPCCVNGGPYQCTLSGLAGQSTLDRTYPEPCCAGGYAVRGDFCSGEAPDPLVVE